MRRQKDPEEEKRLCTKPTLIVRSVLLFKATSLVHQARRDRLMWQQLAAETDYATPVPSLASGNRVFSLHGYHGSVTPIFSGY
jgi:hypothetical protein